MNRQRGYTLPGLLFVLVWIVAIVGWVLNVVKLINDALGTTELIHVSVMTILRLIGVFIAPLGAVLGFF